MSHPRRTIRGDGADARDRALRRSRRRGRCSTRSWRPSAATRWRRSPWWCPPTTWGSRRDGCSRGGALGRVADGGDGIAGVTFLTTYRLAELHRRAAARRRAPPPGVHPGARRGGAGGAGRRAGDVRPGRRAPGDRSRRWSTRTASSRPSTTPRSTRSCAPGGAPPTSCASRAARAPRSAPAWYDERDLMDAAVDAIAAGGPAARRSRRRRRVPPPGAVGAGGRGCSPRSATTCPSPSSPDSPVGAPRRRGGAAPRSRASASPVPEVAVRAAGGDPRRVGVRPRRRGACGRAARGRRAARRRARSSAWRCSTARPSRTRASCTSSSTPRASRTTARRCARWPTACSAAGCSACSRCPTATSSATTSCACSRRRRCSIEAAPRRRRAGSGSAASPRSSAAPSSGSSASTATPVRRSSSSRPSSRSPSASRTPSTSRRELAATRALQDFVATLVARPRRRSRRRGGASSPAGPSASCTTTSRPESRRGEWPEVERRAAEKIEAALARLAGLDAVEAAPGLAVFRRTLELELDADLGRVGRLGDGLLMGHVAPGARASTSTGSSCAGWPRACSRPACATTRCSPTPTGAPPTARSPCAPRGSTTTTGACSRRWPERRSSACSCSPAATSAAPPSACRRASSSRASPRREPGARCPTTSPSVQADWYTPVPSFAAGLARVEFPATEQEHRLRALLDHTRAGQPVGEHELRDVDVALRRGIDTVTARAAAAASRASTATSRASTPAGSPTATSSCRPPGCRPTRPTRSTTSSSTCCGSTSPSCPRSATRCRRSTAAAWCTRPSTRSWPRCSPGPGGAPAPDTPWTDADRARLREIADARCAVYEAQGRTGRRLFWHRDRRRILAELDRFLTEDSDHARRVRPAPGRHRAALRLPRHRARGRPARSPTAACCASAAPPTGSTAPPAARCGSSTTRPAVPYGVDPDDPTAAGTMLQLPVYAHAARASFGDADTPVGAAYWYVSTRGQFRWAELVLTPEVDARVDDVLRAIADGIDAGVFPCRVDPPSTWTRRFRSYTDPDARGTRDRYREWHTEARRPALRGYVALAEPELAESTTDRRRHDGGDGHRRAESTVEVVQQSFLDLDEDLATRAAIVEALDETLFVEAGAGSGKTKALVDRVVALVTRRDVPDARDRRRHLHREGRGRAARPDPPRARGDGARRRRRRRGARGRSPSRSSTAPRCPRCTRSRSGSSPSTPSKPGSRRGIEVLDDIASQLAFEERWTRFVDELLDDPALERALLLALNADTTLTVLRTLALACNANWDLVAERMGPEPDPPPLEPRARAGARRARPISGRAAAHCLESRRQAPREVLATSRPGTTQLARRARRVRAAAPAHRGRADGQASARAARTTGPPSARSTTCGPRSRRCASSWPTLAARLVRARRAPAGLGAGAVHPARGRGPAAARRARVPRPAGARPGGAARPRARVGRPPAPARRGTPVCCSTSSRTPTRSSATSPRCSRRASPTPARHRWDELPVDPGRLFVVGDPKQSIYRFRRADIAAFLRARSAFGASPRRLTRNFRTARPVIDFVNDVFRELIVAEPESQPEYVALEPVRDAVPVGRAGRAPRCRRPSSRSRRPTSCASARRGDVAAVVGRALREELAGVRGAPPTAPSSSRRAASATSASCSRRARRSASSRTRSTPPASPTAPRPRRSSTAPREIRDLLMVLQAVDDPTDELALVSALRSPVFGCGDDDLFTYKVQHGGRWDHQHPLPDTLPPDHPVGDAIRALAAWHDARLWLSPSELLDRVVRERRVLEVGFAHGRPRDLWRRVRFVVEQARAFSEAEGGSLRDFLAWADAAGQRGCAGRRDRAARDRRRRGADPHHPRRQGPRVPDHHRVGHDHQGAVAHRRRAAAVPPRPRHLRRCASRPGSPPRSSSGTRRSTSRWTSTRSSASSTWR